MCTGNTHQEQKKQTTKTYAHLRKQANTPPLVQIALEALAFGRSGHEVVGMNLAPVGVPHLEGHEQSATDSALPLVQMVLHVFSQVDSRGGIVQALKETTPQVAASDTLVRLKSMCNGNVVTTRHLAFKNLLTDLTQKILLTRMANLVVVWLVFPVVMAEQRSTVRKPRVTDPAKPCVG